MQPSATRRPRQRRNDLAAWADWALTITRPCWPRSSDRTAGRACSRPPGRQRRAQSHRRQRARRPGLADRRPRGGPTHRRGHPGRTSGGPRAPHPLQPRQPARGRSSTIARSRKSDGYPPDSPGSSSSVFLHPLVVEGNEVLRQVSSLAGHGGNLPTFTTNEGTRFDGAAQAFGEPHSHRHRGTRIGRRGRFGWPRIRRQLLSPQRRSRRLCGP